MKTQKQSVLEHLQKRKSITSWKAITLYRATRLADIIFKLKSEGYKIIAIMKADPLTGKRWAEYKYLKSK
jgi:hypothetical protein